MLGPEKATSLTNHGLGSMTSFGPRDLGPHSQYSLKEIPKFLQNFRLQYNIPKMYFQLIFGMATMPFLCNGTLLFQGHLPRVLPVTILKYASCLIPYIVSFLNLCGE